MTTYLPGHPDLDGEPRPGDCYCGCRYEAHDADDTCTHCTTCPGYVEHLAVLATRDTLDADDQLDGERVRDNTAAALDIERRARRRHLHLIAGGAA